MRYSSDMCICKLLKYAYSHTRMHAMLHALCLGWVCVCVCVCGCVCVGPHERQREGGGVRGPKDHVVTATSESWS
jgi:hypothetical protein